MHLPLCWPLFFSPLSSPFSLPFLRLLFRYLSGCAEGKRDEEVSQRESMRHAKEADNEEANRQNEHEQTAKVRWVVHPLSAALPSCPVAAAVHSERIPGPFFLLSLLTFVRRAREEKEGGQGLARSALPQRRGTTYT